MQFENAQEAIEKLHLEHLDGEGGYFATTHRDGFGNDIYFLMEPQQFSAWHKLSERETWVFLDGSPVELFTKIDSAPHQMVLLGGEVGEFQSSIEPNTWMAARSTGEFSLVLCFLAPPFSAMTLLSRESFNSWKEIDPLVPELMHE